MDGRTWQKGTPLQAAQMDALDNAKVDLNVSAPQIMAGSLIGSVAEQVNAIGTVTGTSFTLDVTNNRVNTMTLAGDITSFAFTQSLPDIPLSVGVWLAITQDDDGSRSIGWPENFVWLGGDTPSLSTAAGATDVLHAITLDNGTTWLVSLSYQIPSPYLLTNTEAALTSDGTDPLTIH